MKTLRSLVAAGLLAALAVVPAFAQADRPVVLATTTILADVARNVAGDLITVEALIPADADTHAYEPTAQDALRISQADALLMVGAGYETFIEDLLANAGADIPVFVASNGIEILAAGGHDHDHEEDHHDAEATAEAGTDPLATPEADHADDHAHEGEEAHLGVLGVDLECEAHDHDHEKPAGKSLTSPSEAHDDHDHGSCDPHVWTDPANGAIWAMNIAAALGEIDPANAETYAANAALYGETLAALDAEIAALIEAIPAERRVIVTNHEFMGYFAYRYGLEVAATVLPGVTTGAELDPQGAAALIALITDENVPAIFAEVSANPELAQIIAQEAGIAVVTELYSEALSAADGPASTYIDYLRYNAQTIADALSAS